MEGGATSLSDLSTKTGEVKEVAALLADLMRAQHIELLSRLEAQDRLLQRMASEPACLGSPRLSQRRAGQLVTPRAYMSDQPDSDEQASPRLPGLSQLSSQPLQDNSPQPLPAFSLPLSASQALAVPSGRTGEAAMAISTLQEQADSEGRTLKQPHVPRQVGHGHEKMPRQISEASSAESLPPLVLSAPSGRTSKTLQTKEEHAMNQEFRYKRGNRLQQFVVSFSFDAFFSFLILGNATLIGAEVQFEATHIGMPEPKFFAICNAGLAGCFVIELFLRLVAAGGPQQFFRQKELSWNVFDTLLVIISVGDFCMPIFMGGGEQFSGFETVRLIRIIRITRILRLLRVARVVRLVAPLNMLIHSILATLKAMVWAMMLLAVNLYFFSIVFTQFSTWHLRDAGSFVEMSCLSEDLNSVLVQRWGSIPQSMLTLVQSVTGGLDWDLVARPMAQLGLFNLAVYLLFFSVTYFAMFNVITGFFCHAALQSADQDRDLTLRNLQDGRAKYAANLRIQFEAMFRKADGSHRGALSLEEFEELKSNDAVRGFFLLLDIDTSDAWTLFNLLGADQDGVIDAEEFVDGCLRLKGPARGIDLATFRHETRKGEARAKKWMERVREQHNTLALDISRFADTLHQQTSEIMREAKTGHTKAMARMDEADMRHRALGQDVAALSTEARLLRERLSMPPAPPRPFRAEALLASPGMQQAVSLERGTSPPGPPPSSRPSGLATPPQASLGTNQEL